MFLIIARSLEGLGISNLVPELTPFHFDPESAVGLGLRGDGVGVDREQVNVVHHEGVDVQLTTFFDSWWSEVHPCAATAST